MSVQKYHIGKNGPALCNAHPERPNGRACRFGDDRHGTQAEMMMLWEAEQEAEHTAHMDSISKGSPELQSAHRSLSDRSQYRPTEGLEVEYSSRERAVAMKLALSQIDELSYLPIKSRDSDWITEGTTVVERYELEGGSHGYFKAFSVNSFDEDFFQDRFGVSSIGASINEVNAHRLSVALGGEFSKLVPETAFREIYGKLGTIQREVAEDESVNRSFKENQQLRDDYRRAAIFDFVSGNLDRHSENFLYEVELGDDGHPQSRLRLIDNSFSFPNPKVPSELNASIFSDNTGAGEVSGSWMAEYRASSEDRILTESDKSALRSARAEVQGWIEGKTISFQRGRATLKRIDHLLEQGEITNFSQYHFKNYATPDDYAPEEDFEEDDF